MQRTLNRLLACVLATAASSIASAVSPLPGLAIDPSQTTVSGISSGGYMAVQLHVAYSSRFGKGVAAIAGGPYNCAAGNILNALARCLGNGSIPVTDLIADTDQAAKAGTIDAVSGLRNSKVYIFSGANDSVVKSATSAALQAYYQHYLPAANIVYRNDIPSEHAFVTDDFGAACNTKAAPFINNCQFDLAGAILEQLYGKLNARQNGTPAGELIAFDQAAIAPGHGLAETGYVYVPKDCTNGATCRVHVALHGCRQNVADIGEAFIKNSGYNRWADNNRIVVLYPQTGKGAVNSCWDWWGYDSPDYARRSAPQMQAIVAMLDKLAAGKPASAR